jgi:HlyD family secretion protein
MAHNDDPAPAGGGAQALPAGQRHRALLLTVGLVAALLIACLVAWHWLASPRIETTTVATPMPPPAVVGLGSLEPASTVVTIGAPGGGDASRIVELKVAEGAQVQAGQVLAVLDSAAKLAAQLDAAQAQVDLKRLLLQRQRLEIDSTLKARRSALARARAELESSQAEYERQRGLLAQGYVTPAAVEGRKKEFLSAQATVEEMDAALRRTESRVAAAQPGGPGTLIDVAVTERELAAAQADVQVAQASLDQALIRAPFAGRVLAVKARPGERVGSEGVLELGATERMRAVVEVYQTDIERVRVGQRVELRADALPEPVNGTVERIGIAIKRQTVVNNDPATATDARVIDVHVALDAEASRRLASWSRLQVRAVFAR